MSEEQMERRIKSTEVERLARQIAAWKMGLIKDRRGERLPDDLWRQCIPQAVEALNDDKP